MAENVRQLPVADGWTPDRIDLIKRTVCPKGITDDELRLFIEQCKRSGLDPRRQNIGTFDSPNWIEKREFQPAEAGMLARAEQFPDYKGCTASAVREKDVCEIDAGAGTVKHTYSPGKDRGDVLGAWARVVRDGKEPVVVWLEMDGYQQTNRKGERLAMWARIPDTMIEKCARVAALRKAYPEAFGGLYIAEEMAGPLSEQAAPVQPTKTEAVKGKLTAKLQAENQAARISRLTIQDESKTPDRVPANSNPPPSQTVVDAPKVAAPPPRAPHEEMAELAKQHGFDSGQALLGRVGLQLKRAEVTAEHVAKVRGFLQLTRELNGEPPGEWD
jgi:phage recombination protein Bet